MTSFYKLAKLVESLMQGFETEPTDPLTWQALADHLEEQNDLVKATLARRVAQLLLNPSLTFDYTERNNLLKNFPTMFRYVVSERGDQLVLSQEELIKALSNTRLIYGDWGIEQNSEDFIVNNHFFDMDQFGHYNPIDFQLIIPKDNPLQFNVEVDQQSIDNINQSYSPEDNPEGEDFYYVDNDDIADLLHEDIKEILKRCVRVYN